MNGVMAASFSHRLRLGLAIAGSLAISQLDSLRLLMLVDVAAGLLFLATLCRPSLACRPLIRRLLTVNAFVLMVWLTLPWSLEAGRIVLSDAGLLHAALISLRTNGIALLCISLLAGLDAFAVARAATGLGLPDRLARLMVLTVRYLGVLDDTRQRIDLAMRARGFRPRANRRSFEVIAQQLALVLVHAMLRAERVELALRARGFAPPAASPGNTPPRRWHWAAGSTLACACLFWLILP